MKINFSRIARLGLLAFALALAPAGHAQATTNTPLPVLPKRHVQLFHGKVTALDTNAMTVTVSLMTPANAESQAVSLVLNITAETKIVKNGQPATLSGLAAGDTVLGSYKKGTDGKLDAVILRAGVRHNTPLPGPNAGGGPAPAPVPN